MGWLEGKRALVVGAGSGIGRAVLDAFRSEGAQVAALELDEAKAGRLAAELPGCVVSQGDATALADSRAAVRAVTDAFGGLDVLVNCVGIFDFYRGLADIDDDQLEAAFDEVFTVNVKSQLVSVRAALPELRRAGGSVVLTVSTSGPAASRICVVARPCRSRSPARTTRAATCSWPRTARAGSPAPWCTPTAASASNSAGPAKLSWTLEGGR